MTDMFDFGIIGIPKDTGTIKQIVGGSTESIPSDTQKPSGVTVKRYMIEITTYPNGQEYTKCWCVHSGIKQPKKKSSSKKKLPKTEFKSVEEY